MKVDAYTKQVIAIYKCKKCKHTERLTFNVEIRRIDNEHPEHYLHKRWTEYTILDNTLSCCYSHMKELRFPMRSCACGQHIFGKRLEGHVNDSVPCDRRCTHAKGHNCECSCGGANHAIAHAI